MRTVSFLSTAGLLAALATAQAQTTLPLPLKSKTPTPKPATTVIEVSGTIPDSLAGTWLAVINFKRKDGLYVNKWHVYRFSHKQSAWHMEELTGRAPELEKPIEATEDNGKKYEIDDQTVQSVKAALPKFEAQPENETWSKIVWRSAEQFPKQPPPPPQADGAKVSIEFLDAPAAGMISSGGAFYLKDIGAAKITGEATASGIARAGITVVPIDITGPVLLFRLE